MKRNIKLLVAGGILAVCYAVLPAQLPVDRFVLPGYDTGFPASEGGNWFATSIDLDGDAYLDIFLCRSHQPDQVYLNNGDGTFRKGEQGAGWQVDGGSYAVCKLDLDGDGLEDLVVSRGTNTGGRNPFVRNPGRDLVLLNQGDGTFEERSEVLGGDQDTFLLAVHDLDTVNNSMGVASGDFNQDGIPDLVFANGGPQYLINIELEGSNFPVTKWREVLANDIKFGTPPAFGDSIPTFIDWTDSSGISIPDLSTDVFVGDFTGDGVDDIFVACFYDFGMQTVLNLGGNSLAENFLSKLYVNDGSGHFTWKMDALPMNLYPTTSVDAADFDQDGDLDLLLTEEERAAPFIISLDPKTRLFLNDSAGNFTEATNTHFPASYTVNNGATFQHSTFDGHFVDVNGDSLLDVFGAGIQNFLLLQKNDGSHTFEDASHLLPGHSEYGVPYTFHAYGSEVADFNNDGRPDIFLADTYEQNRLQIQLPDGRFIDTTAINLPPEGEDTKDAVIADLNADGKLDIVAVHRDEKGLITQSFLLQGAPVGNFPFFHNHPGILQGVKERQNAIEIADFDHDGRQDLVIAGYQGMQAYRHMGISGGLPVYSEVSVTWLAGLNISQTINDLRVVDIDSDGWMDLLVATGERNGTAPESNQLFRWDSVSSKFVDASAWLPASPGSSYRIDFGHLNADTWPDLLVAEHDKPIEIYLSDTNSLATPGYSLVSGFPNQNSTNAAFADFDNDGDLDILELISHPTRAEPKYFHQNTGSVGGVPQFTTKTVAIDDQIDDALALYDFDQDGLVEALVTGRTALRVLEYDASTGNLHEPVQYFQADTLVGGSQSTHGLALADINGDDRIDLYFARDNQDWLLFGCDANGCLNVGLEAAEHEDDLMKEISLACHPNPFSDQLTIEVGMLEAGEVNLSLWDLTGRQRRQIYVGHVERGRSEYTWECEGKGLTAGMYVLVLESGGHKASRRLIYLKQ